MENFYIFHDILTNLFWDVMNIEEKAIITEEFADITNNDMHIIEAIGVENQKNMSAIAQILSVTVGTLTIAINSLVKKGYVKRKRSEKDKRVVYISLTKKGENAYYHHQEFHRKMIEALLNGLSEEETKLLLRALTNVDIFFQNYANQKKE